MKELLYGGARGGGRGVATQSYLNEVKFAARLGWDGAIDYCAEKYGVTKATFDDWWERKRSEFVYCTGGACGGGKSHLSLGQVSAILKNAINIDAELTALRDENLRLLERNRELVFELEKSKNA